MLCCICNNEMDAVEEVSYAGEAIHVFDRPHDIKYHKTMLYRCRVCTHMQISNEIGNSVYEDEYAVDYSTWKQMEQTDHIYLGKIKALLNDQEAEICEIGCGEGRSLQVAQKYFKEVWGIEPAQKQAALAKSRMDQYDGEVINGFFTENYKFPKVFSAFYSKMVFEHLDNPPGVLKNIYAQMKEGGIGWINVPNAQKIYNENLYYLFSGVHIQYYTPLSLATLLIKAGFEILSVDTGDSQAEEQIEINALFRKPMDKGGEFCKQKQKNIDDIKKELSEDDIVTIWGAGTKAHKYIELVKGISINHIVDKADNKQGLYISGLQIPIEKPDASIINKSTVIIIFASLFNHEIIAELKNMGYCGKVIYFERGNVFNIKF